MQSSIRTVLEARIVQGKVPAAVDCPTTALQMSPVYLHLPKEDWDLVTK